MDFLIWNMPGPQFLLWYGLVILIVVTICGYVRANADPSAKLPALPVPPNPDPLEIAYLRGGLEELSRTLIFDLMQRGYLETDEQSGRAKRGRVFIRQHPEAAARSWKYSPGSAAA
jgi:uncharacterized protein (TIGR04222 family)